MRLFSSEIIDFHPHRFMPDDSVSAVLSNAVSKWNTKQTEQTNLPQSQATLLSYQHCNLFSSNAYRMTACIGRQICGQQQLCLCSCVQFVCVSNAIHPGSNCIGNRGHKPQQQHQLNRHWRDNSKKDDSMAELIASQRLHVSRSASNKWSAV